MRINISTHYAIRTLLFAGAHPKRLVTIKEVAEKCSISENHLMKVVHTLKKLNFIETVQGRKGGFTLAREATFISIGDVIMDFDKMIYVTGGGKHYIDCQPLHQVLDHAYLLFIESLRTVTLNDLLLMEDR